MVVLRRQETPWPNPNQEPPAFGRGLGYGRGGLRRDGRATISQIVKRTVDAGDPHPITVRPAEVVTLFRNSGRWFIPLIEEGNRDNAPPFGQRFGPERGTERGRPGIVDLPVFRVLEPHRIISGFRSPGFPVTTPPRPLRRTSGVPSFPMESFTIPSRSLAPTLAARLQALHMSGYPYQDGIFVRTIQCGFSDRLKCLCWDIRRDSPIRFFNHASIRPLFEHSDPCCPTTFIICRRGRQASSGR